MVLDNGNFRSRDDNKILLPADNDSWIVHLIVNRAFEATMISGYYKNEITNGAGYRYDITSCGFYSS